MKLTEHEQAVRDVCLADAHRGVTDGVLTRDIAQRFVANLRDAERFGETWVPVYIAHLATTGAMKVCSDWRRPQRSSGHTAKGTAVEVPRYVGEHTADGYVTRSSDALSADELRTVRARLEAQRNTLSRRISHLNDALALIDSGKAKTFAEAVALLELAA